MKEEDLFSTFGSSNLYEILGIEKTDSTNVIKKAYHKKSLELHPDRQKKDKENFTIKFQLLHQIYTLLCDKDRKSDYDTFGTISSDDSFANHTFDDWASFWHELFGKVTVEDVISMENEYKGSSKEVDDIKKYYNSSKGDMDIIMDSVMLLRYDEEDRVRAIIDELIKTKDVKSYAKYCKEDPKRRKKREQRGKREAKQVEQLQNDTDDDNDLFKAISLRQEERKHHMDSFFSQLEAKYAQPSKRRKKR